MMTHNVTIENIGLDAYLLCKTTPKSGVIMSCCANIPSLVSLPTDQWIGISYTLLDNKAID